MVRMPRLSDLGKGPNSLRRLQPSTGPALAGKRLVQREHALPGFQQAWLRLFEKRLWNRESGVGSWELGTVQVPPQRKQALPTFEEVQARCLPASRDCTYGILPVSC